MTPAPSGAPCTPTPSRTTCSPDPAQPPEPLMTQPSPTPPRPARTPAPDQNARTAQTEQLRDRAQRQLGAALDRIPFRRAHVLILVLVAFGALFDAIEQYNVGLAAPLIAAQWQLSNAEVGLLTTL